MKRPSLRSIYASFPGSLCFRYRWDRFRSSHLRFAPLLLFGLVMVLTPLANLVPEHAAAASGYSYTDGTNCNEIDTIINTATGNQTVKLKNSTNTPLQFSGSVTTGSGRGGALRQTYVITTTKKCANTGTLVVTTTPGGGKTTTQNLPIVVPGTQTGGGGTTGGYVGTWVDHSDFTLAIAGGPTLTFHDGNIDNNLDYTASTPGCTGNDEVKGFLSGDGSNPQNASTTASITLYTAPTVANSTACVPTTSNITFSNPNAFGYYFVWKDAGTIATTDDNGLTLTQSASPGPYLVTAGGDSDPTCKSQINATPGTAAATLTLWSSGTSTKLQSGWPANIKNAPLNKTAASGACYVSNAINITIADPVGADGKPASQEPAGSSQLSSDTNGTSGPTIDCSVHLLNPLSWFLCPLAVAMESVAGGLDNAINSFMCINTGSTDASGAANNVCGTSGNSRLTQYKQSWEVIRDISLLLLVIAALIAIISESLGYELLDAYTIRKALPRLLIVAIGISVSWPLLLWFIDLTNALGIGIRQLIYAPFSGTATHVALGGGGQVAIGLIAAGGIASLGFVALLSFAATAALAASVAFLVLTLRQMIIVMLVIFSPIAIVCYILPNTQKVWKLWWDSFSKGLLMFPLITGIIAIGRVFAAINSTSQGSINQVIAFTAYFAPYFLIPFTFRLAGGAIGTIGGFVNDKHKGGFNRLSSFRGNQAKKNAAAMKAGNRFTGTKYVPGTRGLATAFNKTSAGIGVGTRGRFGVGLRGAQAIDQMNGAAAAQLAQTPAQISMKDDDSALRAQTYDNDTEAFDGVRDYLTDVKHMAPEAAEHEARRAVKAVQAGTGFGRPQALAAAQQMVMTGTAITDIEDEAAIIARASGGNRSTVSRLAGHANSATKQVGRHDLAPSYGVLQELALQEAGLSDPATSATNYRTAHENAWNSASLYQHANDKPQNLEAHAKYLEGELTSGDNERAANAAVMLLEFKAMQPNATGDAKKVIDATLAQHGAALDSQVFDSVTDPTTGVTTTVPRTQQVTQRDPTDPNNLIYVNRPVTLADTVRDRVREYQRPDPNTI